MTSRSDYKSEEEWRVVLWLQECVKHGLVSEWAYEPRAFVLFEKQTYSVQKRLKTKVNTVDKTLHQPSTYTPDFLIVLTDPGLRLLFSFFEKALCGADQRTAIIDAKGSYNPYQNDQRYFSIVQKAMYDKHGIWPQKVIPFESKKKTCLFQKTFAPMETRFKKDGGLNACGRLCVGIEQFMKGK